MTFGDLIAEFKGNNPYYFTVAADHPFACRCPACITFLAEGLDLSLAEGWKAMRDEPLTGGTENEPEPSFDQIERFMALAREHL